MTDTQVLQWIKKNLGVIIQQAIAQAKVKNPALLYTEDWLSAIACRETGEDIAKYVRQGASLGTISSLMRGDFTQRKGDPEKIYHGFGFWQIDIASFPAFVKSGDWKDPLKCCVMAIAILEGKRIYIQNKEPLLKGDDLARAITAAYNDGEGNEVAVINEKHDIDIRTANHNYSAQVWEFRKIYNSL